MASAAVSGGRSTVRPGSSRTMDGTRSASGTRPGTGKPSTSTAVEPTRSMDPTGLTIVPAKDLVDQWKKAKAELMKDPLMRKIINRLEQKDVVVNLFRTRSPISGATLDNGFAVLWNPNAAQKSVADGTRLSPTVVLGHELDHTHEGLTNPSGYMLNYKTPDTQYQRVEERRVITHGAEASMMRTFYNESPRSDYNVIPYVVADPLSR
jgi:hypothetical protein